MKRDRRHPGRLDLGRRRSERIAEYRPVAWCRGTRRHQAWLVDQSADGCAMVMPAQDAPQPGAVIDVAVHARHPHRFEPCTVARVARESGGLRLVTAEYTPAPSAGR